MSVSTIEISFYKPGSGPLVVLMVRKKCAIGETECN